MVEILGNSFYEIADITKKVNRSKSSIQRDIDKKILSAELVSGKYVFTEEEYHKYIKRFFGKVISFANLKGGVGKTTACQNIGAGLSKRGYKVLMIDFDSQANLTTSFGIDYEDSNYIDISQVLLNNYPIKDAIHNISENMDIIISNPNLGFHDAIFDKYDDYSKLAELIEEIKWNYNYIIIDSPPDFAFLTSNTVYASDRVYIPIHANIFSIHGIRDFIAKIDNFKNEKNFDVEIAGIIVTKYDKRTSIQKQINNDLPKIIEGSGVDLFKTMVRINTNIEEAQAVGKSIFDHAPKSYGASDYSKIVSEMIRREDG